MFILRAKTITGTYGNWMLLKSQSEVKTPKKDAMYIQYNTRYKVHRMSVNARDAEAWKKCLQDGGCKNVVIKNGEVCKYKKAQPKGSD